MFYYGEFDKIRKNGIIHYKSKGDFEMETERNGFSIIGFIAQVLVILLFVFVLMWLFPTKSYIENVVYPYVNNAAKFSVVNVPAKKSVICSGISSFFRE